MFCFVSFLLFCCFRDIRGYDFLLKIIGFLFVVYRDDDDGQTKFFRSAPFEVIGRDGGILTYNCKVPFHENGLFHFAYRAYPWNENLPHRQDFAYLKWF